MKRKRKNSRYALNPKLPGRCGRMSARQMDRETAALNQELAAGSGRPLNAARQTKCPPSKFGLAGLISRHARINVQRPEIDTAGHAFDSGEAGLAEHGGGAEAAASVVAIGYDRLSFGQIADGVDSLG